MTDKEYSYRKEKLDGGAKIASAKTWTYYDIMDIMNENEKLKEENKIIWDLLGKVADRLPKLNPPSSESQI